MSFQGKVLSWNYPRGYGFIVVAIPVEVGDNQETFVKHLFCHISSILSGVVSPQKPTLQSKIRKPKTELRSIEVNL